MQCKLIAGHVSANPVFYCFSSTEYYQLSRVYKYSSSISSCSKRSWNISLTWMNGMAMKYLIQPRFQPRLAWIVTTGFAVKDHRSKIKALHLQCTILLKGEHHHLSSEDAILCRRCFHGIPRSSSCQTLIDHNDDWSRILACCTTQCMSNGKMTRPHDSFWCS
jgi:hypothetical protein